MSDINQGIEELQWLARIAERVEQYAENTPSDSIAIIVTIDELQRLIQLALDALDPVVPVYAGPIAVAYACVSFDAESVKAGAAEERQQIVEWIQRTDLVELVGRRTVSVTSMQEVQKAMAEAIEHRKHHKE